MQASVEADFAAAVLFLQTYNGPHRILRNPTSSIRLDFDALFQQATLGACTSSTPLEPSETASWAKWKALGTMSKDDAMKKYIKMMDDLVDNWRRSTSFRLPNVQATTQPSTQNLIERLPSLVSEVDDIKARIHFDSQRHEELSEAINTLSYDTKSHFTQESRQMDVLRNEALDNIKRMDRQLQEQKVENIQLNHEVKALKQTLETSIVLRMEQCGVIAWEHLVRWSKYRGNSPFWARRLRSSMYNNSIASLERILVSLRTYTDATRVRQDVETLLRQIPSLAPQSGIFTHNNGSTSTMLSLSGTIPIYYGGNQYNIPVEIWMPEAYPFAAPTCFVRPTADMMIRPGHPHVDQNGLIHLPYSTNWESDHSLVELIGYQCSIFGATPPVFRRPANQQPVPAPTYQPNPTPQSAYSQPPQQYGNTFQQPAYSQPPTSMYATTNYAEQSAQNSYKPQYTPPPPQVDPVVKLKAEATEKIQHELQKMYKRIRDEIDLQFETQREISHGQQSIDHGIQSLEQLKAELTTGLVQIKANDEDITQWLTQHENQDEINPDEVLVAVDALSQQQFDAHAERNAIEDALYFMDRALANGEIELQVFLKEVRKLARKQFMCVALMQKVYDAQHINASAVHR